MIDVDKSKTQKKAFGKPKQVTDTNVNTSHNDVAGGLAAKLGKTNQETSKPSKPLIPELSIVKESEEIAGQNFNDIFRDSKSIHEICHKLDLLPTSRLPNKQELSDLVTDELNKIHAIFVNGAKLGVTWDTTDSNGEAQTIFTSESAMLSYYANRKMAYKAAGADGDVKRKTLDIYTAWKENRNSRRYIGVTFDPSQIGNNYGFFNLWEGFKLSPLDGLDKCQLMLDHILNIYCGGSKELYDYFIGYLAHLVQKPWEKPEVAIILRSTSKGSGKSTLVKAFIKPLLGRAQMSTSSATQVTGRFNAHLADKLVLTLEEANFAGDKESDAIIKDLVTRESTTIERKHGDPIEVDSHLRIINITNNQWAVPASSDERRYFVLDVLSDKAQNGDYFNELYSGMENGGAEQMFNYLANYDISKFNVRAVPKTEALKEQIALSLSNEDKYAVQVASSFEVGVYDLEKGITNLAFYEDYCEFVRNSCYGKALPQIQFTKAIKKAFGGSVSTGQQVYECDLSGIRTNRRKKGIQFLNQDDCKLALIENLNISEDSFED